MTDKKGTDIIMNKIRNTLWGIVLIVIGVIIALNALNITKIDLFFDGFWTLFIIVPCFIGIFTEKDKKGNIIGLLIGVLLLLACRDLLDLGLILKLIVPIILVCIGVSFIFKDTIGNKFSAKIKELNSKNSDKKSFCATFSGEDISFAGMSFEGTSLTAVFGGLKCDLTNAVITEDVVINATAIFGGIDIIVPKDFPVRVESSCIFGGVSNKVKEVFAADEHVPVIYVNATALFGGVDVK